MSAVNVAVEKTMYYGNAQKPEFYEWDLFRYSIKAINDSDVEYCTKLTQIVKNSISEFGITADDHIRNVLEELVQNMKPMIDMLQCLPNEGVLNKINSIPVLHIADVRELYDLDAVIGRSKEAAALTAKYEAQIHSLQRKGASSGDISKYEQLHKDALDNERVAQDLVEKSKSNYKASHNEYLKQFVGIISEAFADYYMKKAEQVEKLVECINGIKDIPSKIEVDTDDDGKNASLLMEMENLKQYCQISAE